MSPLTGSFKAKLLHTSMNKLDPILLSIVLILMLEKCPENQVWTWERCCVTRVAHHTSPTGNTGTGVEHSHEKKDSSLMMTDFSLLLKLI